jgi:hypothetical protein
VAPSSLLIVAATATTVSDNSILLHSAEKGLWYDVVHLPEFWAAGIALGVFLVLLRLKRRQDRNYSARPVRSRTAGPAQCEECGRAVSANVRTYCAQRADTFGGQVLCYEHQRPYLQR